MGQASALTAALSSSKNLSQENSSNHSSNNSSSVSSAFPCLYQNESTAEDAFEVDLDLGKLRLSSTPKMSSSRRRSSLDASQVIHDPIDPQLASGDRCICLITAAYRAVRPSMTFKTQVRKTAGSITRPERNACLADHYCYS